MEIRIPLSRQWGYGDWVPVRNVLERNIHVCLANPNMFGKSLTAIEKYLLEADTVDPERRLPLTPPVSCKNIDIVVVTSYNICSKLPFCYLNRQ